MSMRHIFSIAALASLLVAIPAFGQRGNFAGGHGAGFSGHAYGGGFVSHFNGPAFSGPGRIPAAPMHSFGSAPRMAIGTVPRPAFNTPYRFFGSGPGASESGFVENRNRDHGWGGRGGDRDRDRHRPRYRGYGYGYGGYPYAYASSWELLPWDLGYDSGFDSYDDSGNEAAQQAPSQQAAPADQGYPAPDGYSAPDEGYRPEYSQNPYPDAAPPPPAEEASAAIAPEPQLTLIFKDGHQQSIQNYVLTPNAVIVLDQANAGRQQHIPLADLDLAATEQAAANAGLEFAPPA